MEQLAQRLNQAIEDGEIVTIVYAGGSQPGAAREIQPIKLEQETLRARCYRAGAIRTFHLAKLTLLDGEAPSPQKFTPAPELVAPRSAPREHDIEAVSDLVGVGLAALPVRSIMSESAITLHHPNGDGRMLAGIGMSGKGGQAVWYVAGPDGRQQQFDKMENAASMFLAVARWVAADPRPPVRIKVKERTQLRHRWRMGRWRTKAA